MDSITNLSSVLQNWLNLTKEAKVRRKLKVCETVFDDIIDKLSYFIESLKVNRGTKLFQGKIDNTRTQLSLMLTDQETCLDTLEEMNATFMNDAKLLTNNSTKFTSNSLAIMANILGLLCQFNIPIHKKLLSNEEFFKRFIVCNMRLMQEINPKNNV